MKGNPMDPLGMGSLQLLSRVAVHLSCHSCWETARSRAIDTRQAANVARAETRSKESNSMVMESPGSPSVSGALGGVQKHGRKLRKKKKKIYMNV